MPREPLSDHMPDIRRDPELRAMVDSIDALFDAVLASVSPAAMTKAVEDLKAAQTAFLQHVFRRARADRSAFEALLALDCEVEEEHTKGDDDLLFDISDEDASDDDDVDASYAASAHLADVIEVSCEYDLMVLAPRSASVSALYRTMRAFGFRSVQVIPQSVWAYKHKLREPVASLKAAAVVIHTPGSPVRSLSLFEEKAATRRTMPLLLVRCESLQTERVAHDLRVAFGMVSSPVVQRDQAALDAIKSSHSWKPRSYALSKSSSRVKAGEHDGE